MAELRFEANADGKTTITRLGHHTLNAALHTWHTWVETMLWADGHGYVTIKQEGREPQRVTIEIEAEESK